MLKLSLQVNAVQAREQLRRINGEYSRQASRAVRLAMAEAVVEIREAARAQVASQMRVVKKSFLKGFSAKVLDKDRKRLPALYVGSRIAWSGMHETGGGISGRMLIPLNGRVGRKKFKAQVAQLMRGGNAYFIKNAKGHVVLMAENIKEHDKPLAGFKRGHRKATGAQRLKRGADVPIAVLVPRVVLRKRLDIELLVNNRLPLLLAQIERYLSAT